MTGIRRSIPNLPKTPKSGRIDVSGPNCATIMNNDKAVIENLVVGILAGYGVGVLKACTMMATRTMPFIMNSTIHDGVLLQTNRTKYSVPGRGRRLCCM